jgi:hypothetical protein
MGGMHDVTRVSLTVSLSTANADIHLDNHDTRHYRPVDCTVFYAHLG